MKNDDEVGCLNPLPWLKSQVKQSATKEPMKKVMHKELGEKIASLETIIKRERWPPKEREIRPKSEFSAEVARGSYEKKQRIGEVATEGSLADVGMVYALPYSFQT